MKNARNMYKQTCFASKGHNTLELTYAPIINGHDQILFRMIGEIEGFTGVKTEWN